MNGDDRLWAVTSGWDGPFALEDALVVAAEAESAIDIAAEAFAAAGQPICRAKMMIADLGAVRAGLVAGPRRAGGRIDADWRPIGQRCAPVPD